MRLFGRGIVSDRVEDIVKERELLVRAVTPVETDVVEVRAFQLLYAGRACGQFDDLIPERQAQQYGLALQRRLARLEPDPGA